MGLLRGKDVEESGSVNGLRVVFDAQFVSKLTLGLTIAPTCGHVLRLRCVFEPAVCGQTDVMLQQTQLAGTRYGFGASLNLQFAIDSAVVSFDRVQGKEKSLANLTIRESLGNELQYF